ncbi:MAG TPA: DUF805 domain-containing protein [Caulobacteraceae bacterium]|nr:DUF805 domain-containing protein [Caulobacteraceae bacterium]
MLAAVFSFRGRINRLQYFGGLVGLFLSFVVAGLAAVLSIGDLRLVEQEPTRVLPLLAIALIAVPLWIWVSLSLQARRIRDIGLNPLFVIPAYLLFEAIDQAIGTSMAGAPVASLTSVASMMPHHTVLQPVVDLAYSLALLFWPGRARDAPPAASWADNVKLPDPPATPTRAPAPMRAPEPARAAVAVAAGQARPAGPVPFGRRGL